ncbi:MAG: hypothetical protein ACI4WG_05275 [Erysipelotrichaceae bacterium]
MKIFEKPEEAIIPLQPFEFKETGLTIAISGELAKDVDNICIYFKDNKKEDK